MYQQTNQAFISNQYSTECHYRLYCSHSGMFYGEEKHMPSFVHAIWIYSVYIDMDGWMDE